MSFLPEECTALRVIHERSPAEILSPHRRSDGDTLDLAARELRRRQRAIQRDVSEPHAAVARRAAQLARVHRASALLKRVLRLLFVRRKLKAHERALGVGVTAATSDAVAFGGGADGGADSRELAKAAQSVHELEALVADDEIRGLSIVDAEIAYVADIGTRVRLRANNSLLLAVRALDQTDVGAALQVAESKLRLSFLLLVRFNSVLKCLCFVGRS